LFLAVFTPGGSSAWDLTVNDGISPIGFAVLPVCVGVAVLKYRLYDIDRIISRVISYAIVTAVLAGVFAGVVVLTSVVLPLKGSVAVAASTLVAAALFNPLRRRVQRAIDRRFNRALQRRGGRGRVHLAVEPDRRSGRGARRSGRRGR
jgi:amino acid transporter